MNLTMTNDEQFAHLLSLSEDELVQQSEGVATRFLPDDALFSATLKERIDLYVRESFRQDLKRWGDKGSELLDQLSKAETAADIRLIASVGAFIMARLFGVHDVPIVDLTSFALLLLRAYRKTMPKPNAGL